MSVDNSDPDQQQGPNKGEQAPHHGGTAANTGTINGTSFDEAFDLTGHGKFNHLALMTCGFILLYVTVECLGLGFVFNKAECDLRISVTDRGLIAAATLIGVVTPAIFWGYLADEYGRRLVMLPTLVATILSSLCSSLAVNFWNIFILRIITGLLISASCATAYVYLGELHTSARRSTAIAWGSAFMAMSYLFMPGMAWAITSGTWSLPVAGRLSLVPWRAFMWAWCLWGSAAVVGLIILPESPRYILATKGPDAVLPILSKIYAWNNNKKPHEYPVTGIDSTAHEAPRLTLKDSLIRMKYMIRPPLLRCVLISHFCNFLVFLQSNAFYVWMPYMINGLLRNPTTDHSMCEKMLKKNRKNQRRAAGVSDHCARAGGRPVDTRVYPLMMAVGVITLVMYVTIGCVVDRFGKKTVFCAIMATCSILLLVAVLLHHSPASMTLLIVGVCCITANTMLAAVAVEVFPTSLRALALCTLFMSGRLGSAVGAQVIAVAMQGHCTPVLATMTTLAGGSSFLMMLWPDARKVRAQMEAESFVY